MADGAESVSVRHRKCCGTLFNGRFIRFILFKVAVNHGSTLVFRTIFGVARGAKAAAEAGKSIVGIVKVLFNIKSDVDRANRTWSGYGFISEEIIRK